MKFALSFLFWTYFTDNSNALQNTYMVVLFGSFGTKNLARARKLIHNINRNPNSNEEDKLSSNFHKHHNLHILMDFHLVLLKRVCLRSSQPDSRSLKRP
jgi:hypothetical protein